jgi:hypothetical protein
MSKKIADNLILDLPGVTKAPRHNAPYDFLYATQKIEAKFSSARPIPHMTTVCISLNETDLYLSVLLD